MTIYADRGVRERRIAGTRIALDILSLQSGLYVDFGQGAKSLFCKGLSVRRTALAHDVCSRVDEPIRIMVFGDSCGWEARVVVAAAGPCRRTEADDIGLSGYCGPIVQTLRTGYQAMLRAMRQRAACPSFPQLPRPAVAPRR